MGMLEVFCGTGLPDMGYGWDIYAELRIDGKAREAMK